MATMACFPIHRVTEAHFADGSLVEMGCSAVSTAAWISPGGGRATHTPCTASATRAARGLHKAVLRMPAWQGSA